MPRTEEVKIRNFVWKLECKRSIQRQKSMHRWEDNIKIDLKTNELRLCRLN